MSQTDKKETIVLGGGCFWCLEAVYKRVEGVLSVHSGYAGGQKENPTYNEVCTGNTGHAEVVQVEFDPAVISLREILDWFWKAHDPTTLNRQGADRGTQYRSAVYYSGDEQKSVVQSSLIDAAGLFDDPVVTETAPLDVFYPAEDYHSDYYDLNTNAGYCRAVINPKLKKLGFGIDKDSLFMP